MEKVKRKVSGRPTRSIDGRHISRARFSRLKNKVLELYEKHHVEQNLNLDPVGYIDRSLDTLDQELLSFLLQGLCYGRVEQIKKSYFDLLTRFEKVGVEKNGAGLYLFLQNEDPSQLTSPLKSWRHRLNKPSDIVSTLKALKSNVYSSFPSIKECFLSFDDEGSDTYEKACIKFCKIFESKKANRKKWSGTSSSWFAPSPENGGTSKRLMMWLRWMVRDDSVDLGLWNKIAPELHVKPSKLMIPVDTHIFKFATEWNLVAHKNPSWKSVVQITAALKKVDPDDPIKFDFSICHEGKLKARSL